MAGHIQLVIPNHGTTTAYNIFSLILADDRLVGNKNMSEIQCLA